MGVSKFNYHGEVKFDLTADTITKDKLLYGYTAHDKSGNAITGTCDYDVNSQSATVSVAEILEGKTAYARGTKLTGTMPNRGKWNGTISSLEDTVGVTEGAIQIPQGYHDGSGMVRIAQEEIEKLIASNIKQGITILGVEGTLEPSSTVKVQASKTVTPSKTAQTITPDSGYDYLAQVEVEPIPYTETENSAGGITITIG